MKALFLVGIGGAIGSVLRYLVAVLMKGWYAYDFPWHTIGVNVLGCLVIGVLYSWSQHHLSFDDIRLFAMVGILGGFTTYSSFGLETFDFLKQGKLSLALLYLLSTNLFGLFAVYAGYYCYKIIG